MPRGAPPVGWNYACGAPPPSCDDGVVRVHPSTSYQNPTFGTPGPILDADGQVKAYRIGPGIDFSKPATERPMELSPALRRAFDKALTACITEIRSYNIPPGSSWEQKIEDAFQILEMEVRVEPFRHHIAAWRKAVADGDTLLSLEQWARTQE